MSVFQKMTSRYLLVLITMSTLLACTSQSPNITSDNSKHSMSTSKVNKTHTNQPNILFLFTDDQSYDSIGAFGNPDVLTPNIDKLANKGVVFDRHYNTTSICMASRASVMSGMYEYKNGTNFTHGPMAESIWQSSYPVMLKQSGYKVGFAGKFGFAVTGATEPNEVEGKLAQHDFDFWAGSPKQTFYATAKNKSMKKYAQKYPHSTLAYGAASIDFIRDSVKSDQPFMMSVFYKAPHKPSTPDPKFDHIYKDTVFRKLPNYGREAGKHFAKHSQLGRQYSRFKQWGYSEDESYQKELRKYHQLIYGVDQSIGMILEELEKQGIADNTVIIFASDNGYFNGSHGLGSKVLPYEEGARVPLIIYDPRNLKSGNMRRTQSLTAGVDISATILDLATVKIPSSWDGVSLLPILQKPNQQVRASMPHIQVWGPEATRHLTVLDKQFKYIHWYYQDEQRQLVPTEELYDVVNDPYEMTNIAGDVRFTKTLQKMRRLYDKQVEHWQQQSVQYNGYAEYGQLFSRDVSWATKQQILLKKNVKNKKR